MTIARDGMISQTGTVADGSPAIRVNRPDDLHRTIAPLLRPCAPTPESPP
jgi:hypothetical protein